MIKSRVMFGKPDLKELTKDFLCIDMHVHSKYSDSFTSPRRIVKKAKKLDIGICLTDHNMIEGCIEIDKIKEDRVFVPGIEVSSREGPHYLIYFYDVKALKEFHEKYVKPFGSKTFCGVANTDTIKMLEAAKRYDALISAAHPCSILRFDLEGMIREGKLSEEIIRKIDAVEVICGRAMRNMNLRARVWQLENNKMFTGGSDSHLLSEKSRVITYAKAHDTESFLNAIKKKKNFVIGREASIRHRALSYSNTIGKNSFNIRTRLRCDYEYYFKDYINKVISKVMGR